MGIGFSGLTALLSCGSKLTGTRKIITHIYIIYNIWNVKKGEWHKMEIFFLVCEICEGKAQLITHRGKRSEGWLSDLPKDLKVGDVFVGRLKGNERITERSTLPKFIAKAYDFQKSIEKVERKFGLTQ